LYLWWILGIDSHLVTLFVYFAVLLFINEPIGNCMEHQCHWKKYRQTVEQKKSGKKGTIGLGHSVKKAAPEHTRKKKTQQKGQPTTLFYHHQHPRRRLMGTTHDMTHDRPQQQQQTLIILKAEKRSRDKKSKMALGWPRERDQAIHEIKKKRPLTYHSSLD
jgi:hypothetical protein